MSYAKSLADTINSMRAAGVEPEVPIKMLKQVNENLNEMQEALEKMKDARKAAVGITNQKERALCYMRTVVPAMKALRDPADKLEKIVNKKYWPFPTYADLMFEV